MKKSLLIMAALVAGKLLASTPVERMVPISHVYVPQGFDSNDRVEVVVTGKLPNLCHQSPKSVVEYDGNKIKITVSSLYYHESNPFCPEVVVPFSEVVKVGLLNKGNYEIEVNGGVVDDKKSSLKVSEATLNSVDEHVYANVQMIDQVEGTKNILLKGVNPTSCYELEEIKYVSNGKDTLAVLPIMKRVSDFCPQMSVPFIYETEVPKMVEKESFLLHVRRMDGNSVNRIYSFEK